MDGAKIGENSIVAGHTIITENKVFPPNSVIAGVPGKVVATRDCGEANLLNARFYTACAERYRDGIDRLPDDALAQFASLSKPADG
jgi:carbonic anhydrase/acetyltransferase-like protein (isoleucine patch superfamily)